MDSLARMLPALLRQADDSPEVREYAAFAAWTTAAGEGVRTACAPLGLSGRRLAVATADQTWKTQLERLAPQFIFKINSILGGPVVTQVVFVVDPDSVRAAHPAPATPAAGDVDRFRADLETEAGAIGDAGLREAFLRAAGRCLARRAAEPRG